MTPKSDPELLDNPSDRVTFLRKPFPPKELAAAPFLERRL
jgi:hypothetical protein